MQLARWQRWVLITIAVGGLLWIYDRIHPWRENSQDDVILAASAKYRVDAALIKAVVWRESRFYPKARGSKGELGLMQIMEPTARDWAKAEKRTLIFHAELLDREKNTECGAWYLRKLLLRYTHTDSPVPYALADYNAGRGNVLRWMTGPAATNSAAFINQVGFPSTKEYVITTLARWQHYRQTFPPKS